MSNKLSVKEILSKIQGNIEQNIPIKIRQRTVEHKRNVNESGKNVIIPKIIYCLKNNSGI